jgi:hypothetical protein
MSVLLPLILAACGPDPVEPGCPKFDPSGVFELSQGGESVYASVTRSGVETTGSPRALGDSGTDEAAFEWDSRAKVLEIDGISIPLTRDRSVSCNSKVRDGVVPAAWRGDAVLFEGPAGNLSEALTDVGFDLEGNDCSLSTDSGVFAGFKGDGAKGSFLIYQTIRFDDSASCSRALGLVRDQIFSQRVIPAFFFEWVYSGAIELDDLDQLMEIEVSNEVLAVKIESLDTGDTGGVVATTARASKQGLSKLRPGMISSRRSAEQIRKLSADFLK